jgi:hypothetical protein
MTLTPYEQGYQEALEKLGFSFNPLKGLKSLFGGAKPPTTPVSQATKATQLPFAKTRVSMNPGQAASAPSTGVSNIGFMPYMNTNQGRRMPGLLSEPKQQQKYQHLMRQSDAQMYKRTGNPRTNWNIEAGEAKLPWQGDAKHIQNLQEKDKLTKGMDAIRAKNAPQAGGIALNTRMLRQGNRLGREAGSEMPTSALKVGSLLAPNPKERLSREQFFLGLYASVG